MVLNMKELFKIGLPIIAAFLMIMHGDANAGQARSKPSPPVHVSISPVQPGLVSSSIMPGDVVEFKVAATSMVDTTEMQIQVTLADGVELVAGDLSWTGPAMKKEMKTLPITIRVPLKGKGSVKAHVSIALSGGSAFTTSSKYALGHVEKPKPEPARPVRKDSKGRDVIEYR